MAAVAFHSLLTPRAPFLRPPATGEPVLSGKGPSSLAAQLSCRSGFGGGGVSAKSDCGSSLHGSSPRAAAVWGSSCAGVFSLRRRFGFQPPLPSEPRVAAAPRQPSSSKKEDKLVTEGLITELLPNCMFRVRLDNGDVILGYVSGKMRTKMVRVMVGDKVRIEVSRYDSTRGRIVYRLRSKSSTD